MTDDAALLRAIIEHPAEDTPRLVFADWLDEHGNPDRAEFIRGQVRLAQMQPWDDGYTALDVRCRQLEHAHPEWLGVPADFFSRTERFCGQRETPFERGFPAQVELKPAQFVKHHRLIEENPITQVQFAMEGRVGSAWLKQPGLARLTGVEFAYMQERSRVKSALGCLDRVRPLDHFGLVGCGRDELEARPLFAHPSVAGTRSLWIGGSRLTEGAETAFASAAWPNLRRLVRVWVSDVDWLRAPWIGQLRELRVSDTEPNLNPARRRVLTEVLPETDVRALELGWWELDALGGRALGKAVAKSRVQSLAIAQTRTRADTAHALFTPKALAGLRALYLSWAELDAKVVGRLAGTGLRTCALDHTTCDALAALGKKPGLPELTDLRLGLVWKHATDPFADRLRTVLDAGTLPRLVRLALYDTTPSFGAKERHGDQLATAIAGCPAASTLRELHLGEAVTRTGAEALVKSPHLGGLQLLNVRTWPTDKESERMLVDRFGASVNLGIVSIEF